MQKIDHSEMVELVTKAYKTQKSLFVLGGTGIGKSDTVYQAGESIANSMNMNVTTDLNDQDNFRIIDFRVADKRPADLRGLPDLSGDKTVWQEPEFLPDEGKGIIVLEEFNLADKSLQAPAYQLVLDRKMDSYKVPRGFGIVALGNRIEDRANVHELSVPLKNRFDWAELTEPQPDQWIDWAMDNNLDSRVITFIKNNPKFLYRPPINTETESVDRQKKAFPTPRAWETVSDKIKPEPNDRLQFYTSTTVGKDVATQFESFAKLAEGYDIGQILDNPEKAELPNKPDAKYALSSSISQYYDTSATKTQKQKFLVKVIKIVDRLTPAFGALLLRLVIKRDKKFAQREIARLEEFKNLSEEYTQFLTARK